jgi:hypothetical protein
MRAINPDWDHMEADEEEREFRSRIADREERERLFREFQGLMRPEDVARALGISQETLRKLRIPHVKLTRSSRIYFPDDIVLWLRAQERS